ncbi:MAG: TatD family hydrolase, partial [Dehalococcoidia bacterium]
MLNLPWGALDAWWTGPTAFTDAEQAEPVNLSDRRRWQHFTVKFSLTPMAGDITRALVARNLAAAGDTIRVLQSFYSAQEAAGVTAEAVLQMLEHPEHQALSPAVRAMMAHHGQDMLNELGLQAVTHLWLAAEASPQYPRMEGAIQLPPAPMLAPAAVPAQQPFAPVVAQGPPDPSFLGHLLDQAPAPLIDMGPEDVDAAARREAAMSATWPNLGYGIEAAPGGYSVQADVDELVKASVGGAEGGAWGTDGGDTGRSGFIWDSEEVLQLAAETDNELNPAPVPTVCDPPVPFAAPWSGMNVFGSPHRPATEAATVRDPPDNSRSVSYRRASAAAPETLLSAALAATPPDLRQRSGGSLYGTRRRVESAAGTLSSGGAVTSSAAGRPAAASSAAGRSRVASGSVVDGASAVSTVVKRPAASGRRGAGRVSGRSLGSLQLRSVVTVPASSTALLASRPWLRDTAPAVGAKDSIRKANLWRTAVACVVEFKFVDNHFHFASAEVRGGLTAEGRAFDQQLLGHATGGYAFQTDPLGLHRYFTYMNCVPYHGELRYWLQWNLRPIALGLHPKAAGRRAILNLAYIREEEIAKLLARGIASGAVAGVGETGVDLTVEELSHGEAVQAQAAGITAHALVARKNSLPLFLHIRACTERELAAMHGTPMAHVQRPHDV